MNPGSSCGWEVELSPHYGSGRINAAVALGL